MPSDSKSSKGSKAETKPLLGPDGKPLPPQQLTETEQVQLQVENAASEVLLIKPLFVK